MGSDLQNLAPAASLQERVAGYVPAILTGVATLGLASAALIFTREVHRFAAVWPVNALVVAILLRTPTRAWSRLLLAGLIGIILANLRIGDSPLSALTLAGCNGIEIWLCAGLMRRFSGEHTDLSRKTNLLVFLGVAGLLAPAVSAGLAATVLMGARPGTFLSDAFSWFAPDALGLLTITPALLAVTPDKTHDLLGRLRRWRGWIPLVVLAVTLALAFTQSRYPILFLIPPALTLVAFELGMAGAALALLASAVVAVILTLTGHGPAMLIHGGMTQRLGILQLFLATLTVSVLPVAAALAKQRRLRSRLTAALAETQKAQAHLAEAHRLSVLAEQIAGIGHWRRNLATGEILWSDQMYVIHGFDEGRSGQRHIRARELYHAEDQAIIEQTVVLASQTGEAFDLRVKLRRANDGQERLVIFKGEAEREAHGQVIALFGVMRDITEDEAAKTAIAESEARYRLLTANATDIVACYGVDSVFTFLSPSVETILGYAPSELVGRSSTSIMHPEDAPQVFKQFRAYVASGARTSIRFDYRAMHKNGQIVWLEAQATTVFDPETGRIVEFQDVVRDITARKAVEAELAASNLRYRVISQNATDIVSRTGVDGVVLQVSPSITDVAGYGVDEIVGRDWAEFLHPDDAKPALSIYRDMILGTRQDTLPISYRVRHKDGRWIWFEGNPTPLRDPSGVIIEFIDVTRDISARARLEAELRNARDAAEAAAGVKADFMANISHEIRTPLTAILGFTSLLATDETLSGVGRGRVERIAGAGQALLSIVNDVLDFTKLEAGQFYIVPEPIDPAEVLSEALLMFAPQAEAKGLGLRLEMSQPLPLCLAIDKHRLRQILHNLIGNAIKFTASGHVALRATYDERHERLQVAIQDTGPGMNKAQRGKLFQRFSQVDASSTRSHGGTGLGLAICKGLTEAMGGKISVQSQPGKGSTFQFEIIAPPAAPAKARQMFADVANVADLDGVRVLIADDNPVNRELVRAILVPMGMDVTDAADGEAALTYANDAPFDILLLDVRMPGLSGPEVAARIRTQPGPNSNIPILAFTADVELIDLTAPGSDFDGVISKPISPTDLILTLAAHLKWDAPMNEVTDVVAL